MHQVARRLIERRTVANGELGLAASAARLYQTSGLQHLVRKSGLVRLLPGTLPAGSDDDGALLIHCLDVEQPVADNLSAEEVLFSRMIGHD